MEVTLKIVVRNTDGGNIKGVLEILGAIKNDHPDLFQQAEVVIHL